MTFLTLFLTFFKIGITALFAGAKAMMEVLKELKEKGTDEELLPKMLDFESYFQLVGAEKFRAMDEKYLLG